MRTDAVGPSPDMALPAVELVGEALSEITDVELVALTFTREDDEFRLGPRGEELGQALGVDLRALLRLQEARGTAGEVHQLPVLDASGLASPSMVAVLLVGTGQGRPADLRRAGAAIARRVRDRERVAAGLPAQTDDAGLRAFVEGLVLGSFTFHRRSTSQPQPARCLLVADPGGTERAAVVERAFAVGRAGWQSRVLALTPANEKTPAWLADRARDVAEGAGLAVRVWDEEQLAEEGFGGLVAVGRASASPPRLVQLGYEPAGAGRRTPHVVLVGKGITFDTGGLSIKPAEAMTNMKRDMTGAGVVLAVVAALPTLGCRVRVTGLLACAENAVDGNALRPGDVIRHIGGRTSEVTNTDAEGRLVLADALAYAADALGAQILVDVATLTGAMKVSLGQRLGGLFASDDTLAGHLLEAGRAAGEPLWRMPLVDDYEERMESSVADADNAAGTPGAITAALFLRHFTGGLPWAHLDIASVGDSPVDAFEWTSGATGFGARALLHWLEQPDPLEGVG